MTVGVLLVTHMQIGEALLAATETTYQELPLATQVVDIDYDMDAKLSLNRLKKQIDLLDKGDGVLVLTDMYGATPSNLAQSLHNDRVALVTGLNLPMLIRVMNYPTASLSELAEKAHSGGCDGVIKCEQRHVA